MDVHAKYYGKTMEEMLALTEGAVEADGFSQHMLWVENRTHFDTKYSRSWKQIGWGWAPQIAEVTFNYEQYPIVVSISWAVISEKLVLFYYCCSMVSHMDMVDKWVLKMCPKLSPRKMQDAMNFTNIFRD